MRLTRIKLAAAVALFAAVASGTGSVSYQAVNAHLQPSGREQGVVARSTDDDTSARKDGADAGAEDPNRDVAGDINGSLNNLKQLGLAMHRYHDAHGHLPTCAIHDKNDKPLLSWRVALLPYLDAENLYQQFRLDEAWDSKHNKKLLGEMPAVFRVSGIITKKANTTFYQVIAGKGAVFDGVLHVQLRDIADGTANTIMAIEAKNPVPWTKPEDLVYDSEKPLPKFGGAFARGFNVLAADGSTFFIQKGFNEAAMRAVITRAGGEPTGFDQLLNR